MKSWILVVAAIAALVVSSFADYECHKHEDACMEEGDKCVDDFAANFSYCMNHTDCCAIPLHCVKGKCVEDTRVCFPFTHTRPSTHAGDVLVFFFLTLFCMCLCVGFFVVF